MHAAFEHLPSSSLRVHSHLLELPLTHRGREDHSGVHYVVDVHFLDVVEAKILAFVFRKLIVEGDSKDLFADLVEMAFLDDLIVLDTFKAD